jgi:threonine dehydrogenase-like Zn-dependent dehydrogenase
MDAAHPGEVAADDQPHDLGRAAVDNGDPVIAPFIYSDMTFPHCLNGSTVSCPAGGNFGDGVIDGGQGQAVHPAVGASDFAGALGLHSDSSAGALEGQ